LIAGFFEPTFPDPLPLVRVGLYLPGITSRWVNVDFLLDTGADGTALHPRDAIFRVGLDPAILDTPEQWVSPQSGGGVGGSSDYYPHPAHYALRHDDGRVQVIRGEIWIARPTPDNSTLESLLGWDILRQFRVSLDWANRRIALE
jgi:hypothetical protein